MAHGLEAAMLCSRARKLLIQLRTWQNERFYCFKVNYLVFKVRYFNTSVCLCNMFNNRAVLLG